MLVALGERLVIASRRSLQRQASRGQRRNFAKRQVEEIDEIEVEEIDPSQRIKNLKQMLKKYVVKAQPDRFS
jgi:hypothetical protein